MRTVAKTCFAALMTLTALGASAVVSADDRMHEERVVAYDDLNLNTPAGSEKLYRRLRVAAKHVCGGPSGAQPHLQSVMRTCTRQSLNEAVMRIGHPSVIGLHVARTRATEKIRTAASS